MFRRKNKHRHMFTMWEMVQAEQYAFRSGQPYEITVQRRRCTECGWIETAFV